MLPGKLLYQCLKVNKKVEKHYPYYGQIKKLSLLFNSGFLDIIAKIQKISLMERVNLSHYILVPLF